jgi:HEAT repeat protein
MFGFGKKEIPEKKLRQWQNSYRVEKIVDALHNAPISTRLKALEVLSEINMTQVKKELLTCLNDSSHAIAERAAKALEHMGATPEERIAIAEFRKKHPAK